MVLKKFHVIIGLILSGLILFVILKNNLSLNSDNILVKKQIIESSISNSETSVLSTEKKLPPIALVEKILPISSTNVYDPQKDGPVVKNWNAAKGYTSTADSERIYEGYDNPTLKKLSLDGDPIAISVFGKRLWRDYGSQIAFDFYKDMAIRGSTLAIDRVVNLLDSRDFSNAKTDDEKKRSAIEMLSYSNLAVLRGDRHSNIYYGIDVEASLEKSGIILTDDDKQKIIKNSQDMYNDWQSKRNQLGLGEFDNSVPPEMVRYFDMMEKLFRDAKSGKK